MESTVSKKLSSEKCNKKNLINQNNNHLQFILTGSLPVAIKADSKGGVNDPNLKLL